VPVPVLSAVPRPQNRGDNAVGQFAFSGGPYRVISRTFPAEGDSFCSRPPAGQVRAFVADLPIVDYHDALELATVVEDADGKGQPVMDIFA
jgi:hypothetical protein